MKVLIIGAGVIGTVYGAQLGAGGHEVSVLAHGARTDEVAQYGLRARDVLRDEATHSPAAVTAETDGQPFDLVLVALRCDDLQLATVALSELSGRPLVLFFGNNPDGRAGGPTEVPGTVCLGFPGTGGTMKAGVAHYVRIAQQPTALEQTPDPRLDELQTTLESRGFPVQRVSDMSGWLAYHAVFVASISAALYHCQTDPRCLAGDRGELKLMCRAVTEGFCALHAQGVRGLPTNLAILHARAMQPIAVRYWARSMRSPMGELAFAAHSRHAEPEMRSIARDVLARLARDGQPPALSQLLSRDGSPTSVGGADDPDRDAALQRTHEPASEIINRSEPS